MHYELPTFVSNHLSGKIPTSLGQCIKLQVILLSLNDFMGSIPTFKDIRKALIVCEIPSNLSHCRELRVLSLSFNQLTRGIPQAIGSLCNLEELYLAFNKLTGGIPREIGNLSNLNILYPFSKNLVSGYIPRRMGKLQNLAKLSLSQNRLQSPIPVEFGDLKTKSFIKKYILLTIASTVTLVAFIVLWIRRRDNMEIPAPIDSWLPGTHGKISYQQLLYATNDFGGDNLIGKGSLGMIYKGVLSNGLNVAIKVFNLEFQGALRSFNSECEVMQRIRHQNLVKIINCCSNLDFKALVLKYMPNGSLDKGLYSHNHFLDLIQRLNIMIDVASALEYLHLDCSSLVVHCDLKPNNVLLDDDMVAHVADFRITRLLIETKPMQQTKTLGTIGYMAPEYGLDGIVSIKVDVYSYGIFLMEVFARKKPMDEMSLGI
ncbi:unnamed protein product, partial [Vitis vinifera]|uniref:Protein kinase domain-containing protein n=1 Tax=Vitis vinifera TaxID=29760 RepID=D7TKJ1_VITVI